MSSRFPTLHETEIEAEVKQDKEGAFRTHMSRKFLPHLLCDTRNPTLKRNSSARSVFLHCNLRGTKLNPNWLVGSWLCRLLADFISGEY